MKTLKEIENISLESLEQIAGDFGISVPKDLRDAVRESVAAAAMGERASSPAPTGYPRRPLWRPLALLGVAAAALIGVFFVIPRNPEDTYDDPLVAYAKVEETFAYISSQLDRGTQSLRQAEEPLEKVNRIFNSNDR